MLVKINRNSRKEVGLGWKPGRGTNPQKFRASAVLPKKLPERVDRKWWANGWWGDQGLNTYSSSECVIYSWEHAIHDGPVTPRKKRKINIVKPILDPTTAYIEGQGIDGTDPNDKESGLTCYAGAEVFKRHGIIGEYRWGETVDEIVHWLLEVGPVLRGAPWYNDDFELRSNGLLLRTGGVAGGHQTKGDAANTDSEIVWFKNSWSREWGNPRSQHPSGSAERGFYAMSFDQIESDLRNDGAEYCMYRELPSEERIA